MSTRQIRRASTSLILVALLMFTVAAIFVGCGSTGTGGNSGTGSIVNPTTPTGSVVLVPVLGSAKIYSVPPSVTQFRISGYDVNQNLVYSATVPKASPVTLRDVPTSVVTLRYELLSNANVAGSGNFAVQVVNEQTTTIDNPPFTLIVVGTNALLPAGQRYEITGADSGTVSGGVLNGHLVFDGNGNITSGQITRTNIFSTPNPTTVFNVTGGTYQVAANRNFSATLNTNQYALTMRGQVSRSPAGGAIYAAVYGSGNGDALSGLTTLQVNGSGFSAASLNGSFATNAFNVAFTSSDVGYSAGTLVFDGTGNVSGSLQGRGASAPWSGTYTVTPQGVVNATLTVNGGNAFSLQGAVGTDKVLTLAGATGNVNFDQYFLLASPVTLNAALVNVQPTMYTVGMRSLTGGLAGVASFNAGNNTVSGGSYDEYAARVSPVTTSNTPFQGGSFTVTAGGSLQGGNSASNNPLQLVGGVFTDSQAVFFGVLVGGNGDPLQFNQQLMILAE